MSRARATALALVNWKGVFYERYQLDRRVTALEGANGAGKTTVMIAAYIVLLPDMTRLRFTNLGETAAIGGDRGIWGRLGEPTRPSYAALELELGDGVRVVAGVHLLRKAEPTLELTPFLISELKPGVRLSDLLLLVSADEEAVPQLTELRQSVTAAQAKLEVFSSAKDYFAALFELGVGALRLSSDEDRGRLGDMLRTSMTGGISRAITAELRSFLLREQASIGDTLGRMRENLNACRRTRIEVSEAQLLEQEISGVYDAGQGMFAAALQATRERASEHKNAAARLAEEAKQARQALLEGSRAAADLENRETELTLRLKQQNAELEGLREQARLLTTLAALRDKQRGVDQEREAALVKVTQARAQQAEAVAERETERQRRGAAQLNQQRAALGLADLQAGLDELHRRASAYRSARRAQADVATLSGAAAPSESELPASLVRTRQRLVELDTERLSRERTLTLAAQRQKEWELALALLGELGDSSDAGNAFERSGQALRELQAIEHDLANRPALISKLAEHRSLEARQQAAQKTALALGLELGCKSTLQQLEGRLTSADAQLSRLEAQKQALAEERTRLGAERELTKGRLALTQTDLGKHRRLLQRVESIETSVGPFAPTRDAVLKLRDSMTSERLQLTTELEEKAATRERLLRDANQLEGSGGQFPAELLKLRDDLDGELLGNRFEELDVTEAARLEALLGPLTQAIVVEDVVEATERLHNRPRELSELRLIASGTDLSFLGQSASETSGDLCVQEGPALRITRRPERPTLGRKAREARIHDLRRNATALGRELEQRQARLRSLHSALTELDQILPHAELLERGDPSSEQALLESAQQKLAQDELLLDQALVELAARLDDTRLEAGRCRGLLSEAFLLDVASHAEQARHVSEQLQQLDEAGKRLQRLALPRRKLEALADALRVAPPAPEELSRLQAERESLGTERDRAFRLLEAVEQLSAGLPALGWQDAERSLQNHEQIAPALEQQHQQARASVADAECQVLAADARWEEATTQLQREEATLSAIAAHDERLQQELASLGLAHELTPERAALQLGELTTLAERLVLEEREVLSRRGAQAERVRQLGQDLAEVERDLAVVQGEAGPVNQRWQALRARTEAALLLHSGETSEHDEPRSALELAAEARSRAELLQDRLAAARGGETLSRELSELSLDEDESFLDAWLRVRQWLARRVPTQVAEVDDPLLALERLRGHLSVLEQRLTHQEADLRGASEDVARGIEVQLRRAKAQVRRLNQNLDGVSFGSIAGIRVEMRRSQQMAPVLRALAEGSAQELLFQSNLPMEEALSEILRRFGGGRSGGGRVLDYREYLELVVLVQRKADASWEPANPTRLSTGEAIGVGAALMMVVLAEWERDANLLRARRGPGSLRFLFLDEANRLSQDNLGSLFDLCESLDLQLLIAAPEVARSEGNTTYRLVRKVSEDGREEVIVSGRRALGGAVEAAPLPDQVAAVQGVLFEN